MVTVGDDHDDGTPTVGEIGDHVAKEVSAAKGQFHPAMWQSEVTCELETARLMRAKPKKGPKTKVGWPENKK